MLINYQEIDWQGFDWIIQYVTFKVKKVKFWYIFP